MFISNFVVDRSYVFRIRSIAVLTSSFDAILVIFARSFVASLLRIVPMARVEGHLLSWRATLMRSIGSDILLHASQGPTDQPARIWVARWGCAVEKAGGAPPGSLVTGPQSAAHSTRLCALQTTRLNNNFAGNRLCGTTAGTCHIPVPFHSSGSSSRCSSGRSLPHESLQKFIAYYSLGYFLGHFLAHVCWIVRTLYVYIN